VVIAIGRILRWRSISRRRYPASVAAEREVAYRYGSRLIAAIFAILHTAFSRGLLMREAVRARLSGGKAQRRQVELPQPNTRQPNPRA